MLERIQHIDIKQISNKGSNPCIYSDNEKINLDEILARSKALARILKEVGCRKGDSLCCLMSKSIDFLICVFGIRLAGCICVPVDPDSSLDYLQAIILECDANWLIADEQASPHLETLELTYNSLNLGWMGNRENLPLGVYPEFVRDNISSYKVKTANIEFNNSMPAFVFSISQKIDEVRGVFLNNAHAEELMREVIDLMNVKQGDRFAGFLPVHSPEVLVELLSPFYTYSHLYLFDSDFWLSPLKLFQRIKQEKITQIIVRSEALEHLSTEHVKWSEKCPELRQIAIWGKLPTRKSIEILKSICPRSEIKNFYSLPNRASVSDHVLHKRVEAIKNSSVKISEYEDEKVYLFADEIKTNGIGDPTSFPKRRELHMNFWKNKSSNGLPINPNNRSIRVLDEEPK